MVPLLPNHLMLRHVRGEADKKNFAALSATYNNIFEGATCDCLLNHHPQMTDDDFWLVEDLTTRQVVSTICLIPWNCQFDGLQLRAAQLEMVLTHPDYRGQGLVRAQIHQFEQEVKNRDIDLSFVWGIPYYYRQYGYSYAVDGACTESLPVYRIPECQPPCRLRPATSADIPRLMALFPQSVSGLDIYLTRAAMYWEYLLSGAKHPIHMVENGSGQAVGYAILTDNPERAVVTEAGFASAESALDFLSLLKRQVSAEVLISWPQTTFLAQAARSLGSQTIRGGQWLVRVPDMTRLLAKMAPILEKRLADSPWRGATTQVTINLFREAFRLRLEGGQLRGVDRLGFVDSSMGADGGDLCIPPDAFHRLLLGFRSLDQLTDAWPDITLKPASRSLVETLFPQMQSYLSTPYHYMG